MTDPQIDAWFWILVGFAGGLVTIGVPCLGVVAYASWRRRVREPAARERIVVSTKHDGCSCAAHAPRPNLDKEARH